MAVASIDRFHALGLSRETAARFVGVSPTTFDQMVRDGIMPKPKRVGRRNLWSRIELEICFDALPTHGDAQPNAGNEWDDVA